MKKRKIWLLLTAILIILVLTVCGCGKKKEEVKPAPTETKQAAKDETKTETKDETKNETKEAQTEEPYDDGEEDYGPTDAQCVQITMTLLNKLQYVTRVGAGAVQKDTSIVYTDPNTGLGYNLVTEPGISSFYDIYQMLYNNFTNGCIDERWIYMIQPAPGTPPFFQLVQDGSVPTGIYIVQAGSGFMDYTPTGDIGIEHLDDRHFIATVPFQSFGETLYLTMDIILEEDWKINGFNVSD